MNNWYLDFIAEERRHDAERSFAQNYRLVKDSPGVSWGSRLWSVIARIYRSLMVSVGSWMVNLGCRLRSRYEMPVAASLSDGETAPCA